MNYFFLVISNYNYRNFSRNHVIADTEARAAYYRQRFRDEILLNCSPLVHISHLLCAIPSRKQVEDEIVSQNQISMENDSCHSHVDFILPISGGRKLLIECK
eukprot:TRINITY_DN3741_c1_g1_i3.p1 TRINITY_DN3741_c1_g1~~TRINITY_DN3741_c1_g1_i3.p1  ORF type:complete len:102 (-),score=0.78 TRINITY_DN3741_c1_g1_i3:399-704(-)